MVPGSASSHHLLHLIYVAAQAADKFNAEWRQVHRAPVNLTSALDDTFHFLSGGQFAADLGHLFSNVGIFTSSREVSMTVLDIAVVEIMWKLRRGTRRRV